MPNKSQAWAAVQSTLANWEETAQARKLNATAVKGKVEEGLPIQTTKAAVI